MTEYPFYPMGNTIYEGEMRLKTRMIILSTILVVVGILMLSRLICIC